MMTETDFTREIPKDQLWVYNEEFEKAIYNPEAKFPPVKAITHGPKFHWFSYYDKFQTDPSGRFVLSMEVDFEDRSPQADDVIKIGMVDIKNNNEWIELGQTRAWCWQQGCMLQWRPKSDNEIIYNDHQEKQFVCRIMNVNTREVKTLPHPVSHIHPDGKKGLVADFPRIQNMRPGYGYAGVPDKNANVLVPEDSYISVMDMETGKLTPVISVRQIVEIDYSEKDINDDNHYFNCPAWSPDGSRFLFLNRWRSVKGIFPDFKTRMFTAFADGSDIRLVTDKPYISHFTWRDSEHIAMWREDGYKLFSDDGSGKEELILAATNGHLSYMPGNEWIIADTYHDKQGCQNIFLFHVNTGNIIPIGRFFTPQKYRGGELRCDLHPRISRDGKTISIDSVHGSNGRQLYLINIIEVINNYKS
jgi:hypothetical protein